jgi:hypothetical protein
MFAKKVEESCESCRFFWFARITGAHSHDRGKCCYLPEPQPTKLRSDWCGQWQLEKSPESELKELG